jgi:hypothetical protein
MILDNKNMGQDARHLVPYVLKGKALFGSLAILALRGARL